MKTTFAIAWSEFNKNDQIITKSKEFKNEASMINFSRKLEDKSNFNEFIAFSYPE